MTFVSNLTNDEHESRAVIDTSRVADWQCDPCYGQGRRFSTDPQDRGSDRRAMQMLVGVMAVAALSGWLLLKWVAR